jgi:DNA-binding LacI/PurR family transcriptional regulator
MSLAERVDPPLTTIRQPVHSVGYVAADTLIDLVAHRGSQVRRIILPTELIVRTSTDSKI